MKCKVEIPINKTKRLNKNRFLHIAFRHAFSDEGSRDNTYHRIPEGIRTFEFDIDIPPERSGEYNGPFEWCDRDMDDGWWRIDFYIQYENETGSRFERLKINPEIVDGKEKINR